MIPIIFWPKLRRRRGTEAKEAGRECPPLREFVYLDEGSLRSLLSSQTGEIKETVSEQTQAALLDEIQLKVAGQLPLAAKGEAAYRFQATNSSSLQTSRKATVQSWFRDFHDRDELRLISVVAGAEPAANLKDLASLDNPSVVAASDRFERGVLAEFRVRLAAHPVFHLTTMMTEFTGMAEDFGAFVPDASVVSLKEIQPMVKVLQRLMAGLIPVTAEAIDYVVVGINGTDYVVHRKAIAGLQVEARPLVIAGVTELQSYWKDIRHLLFSNAEFTLLCRVSRSGLQADWTPVKLVHLFDKIAPDFARQMSMAWKIPFGTVNAAEPSPLAPPPEASPLEKALFHYATAVLKSSRHRRSKEELAEITHRVGDEIHRLAMRTGSVSDQKSAFVALRSLLVELAGARISGPRDLKLRDEARSAAGLSLFPSLAPSAPATQSVVPSPEEPRAHLDVEVVAIYW